MPKSLREREKRALHKKLSNRLPKLLNNHEHKCFWCKHEIVQLRSVPKDEILGTDHGYVTYLDGRKVLIASVDHLISLFEGGTSDMVNLVPSCRFCNEDRGRQTERLLKLGDTGLVFP